VASLPDGLTSSIFVVWHTLPSAPSLLDYVLGKAGRLPASNARDWLRFEPGHIYTAPADHHLTLDPAGCMRISRGPRESRFRPSVDVLFRSAASAFGPRVVGIVLSGRLDDGTSGLWAIKERGGVAIVQDPRDAIAQDMPRSALRHVAVDHCVPARAMADIIVRLSREAVDDQGAAPGPRLMTTEVKIAHEQRAGNAAMTMTARIGRRRPSLPRDLHDLPHRTYKRT
jgi:two-component system chemotaxis response regulator CheB